MTNLMQQPEPRTLKRFSLLFSHETLLKDCVSHFGELNSANDGNGSSYQQSHRSHLDSQLLEGIRHGM